MSKLCDGCNKPLTSKWFEVTVKYRVNGSMRSLELGTLSLHSPKCMPETVDIFRGGSKKFEEKRLQEKWRSMGVFYDLMAQNREETNAE